MRVLLHFAIFAFGSAGRTVEKAKGGGPGTQTVLLIKGGVGVNLLATSPEIHTKIKDVKPRHHALELEASELEGEQQVAADLTVKLQNTVDSSKKLEQQVRSLKARTHKAEKLLGAKDQQLKQLQNKQAEKDKSLKVKNQMLLRERHENELLKKKVKDLEQDIEISNHAWKEAADHEKEVAEEAKETAKEEAAKNDRLSTQIALEKPHKKVAAAAPQAMPSHSNFMKSLKKQTVKVAKAAKDDVEPVIDTLDAQPGPDEIPVSEESAYDSDNAVEQDTTDAASDSASEDQTEVPSEDEPMPVAEDTEEQPGEESSVKQAKETVVKPPMVHATRDSADVQSGDAASDEAGDTSEAEKEDESNWTLSYSPAGRAATVEDSVEGDAESEDVLSPNAPMPAEEDPDASVKPDLMGQV